jgi:uncharacterized protein with PQ loop repeat
MSEPAIHKHTRERVFKKLEPYPHPDKFKNLIDRLIYIVAFFGIVFTIPQITNIWIDNDSSGVSFLSWGAYLIMAGFWLLYGVLHKEKPMIIIYSCLVILDFLIVLGLLLKG